MQKKIAAEYVRLNMINPEQKELAEYVKHVHLSLRCKSREIGAEKAWEEHVKNEEVLRKYAFSMKKLAEFWAVNNQSETDTFLCRIQWIVKYANEYFQEKISTHEYEKEFKKMRKFCDKGFITSEELKFYDNRHFIFQSPFKLLDVGSCYNPFQKFNFFEVYPIDLFPANSEVKKCNFIETSVVNLKNNWFHDNLEELPAEYFDLVVFSLFLEYLPSPRQRYLSCVKAYECLKSNGLLLIVTPDSKHATANAVIMKSWKKAAAHIGFVRTKLEKLKYLYCMAFRKATSQKYPLLLYNIKINDHDPENMFVIPQDSVDYKSGENLTENPGDEAAEIALFNELPFV